MYRIFGTRGSGRLDMHTFRRVDPVSTVFGPYFLELMNRFVSRYAIHHFSNHYVTKISLEVDAKRLTFRDVTRPYLSPFIIDDRIHMLFPRVVSCFSSGTLTNVKGARIIFSDFDNFPAPEPYFIAFTDSLLSTITYLRTRVQTLEYLRQKSSGPEVDFPFPALHTIGIQVFHDDVDLSNPASIIAPFPAWRNNMGLPLKSWE
ncbi:hypothetical protein BDZ97DRAFT_1837381 [Flammula alnicola]|nr:hypothetical protein BDZ97DRAFT_1837381 [Flammula alnicola]